MKLITIKEFYHVLLEDRSFDLKVIIDYTSARKIDREIIICQRNFRTTYPLSLTGAIRYCNAGTDIFMVGDNEILFFTVEYRRDGYSIDRFFSKNKEEIDFVCISQCLERIFFCNKNSKFIKIYNFDGGEDLYFPVNGIIKDVEFNTMFTIKINYQKTLSSKIFDMNKIYEEKENFYLSVADYLLQKIGKDMVGEVLKYLSGYDNGFLDSPKRKSIKSKLFKHGQLEENFLKQANSFYQK